MENPPDLPTSSHLQERGRPITSIVAILRSATDDPVHPPDAYLMIQRIKAPYKNQWAMVGGKWDFGESLEEAIIREVSEETGIEAAFLRLRGIMNERILPLDEHISGGHYILFVCELQACSGAASEQAEGPVCWFTFQELTRRAAAGEVIPTDYELLKLFRSASMDFVFIEAEVHSQHHVGKRHDRIKRFERISALPD